MNVSLTKELERFVNEMVKRGRYGSASEVVRDGLRRLVEEQELLRRAKIQWLREAVEEAEESARKHGWLDGEKVFAELRTKAKRLKAARAAQAATRTVRKRAG